VLRYFLYDHFEVHEDLNETKLNNVGARQMKNENICDWLRDAHAMEVQAEKFFSGQADRLKDFADLSSKLRSELTFIEANKMLLLGILKIHGSDTSTLKDTFGKFMGFEQNMAGTLVSDEPVKGILALHTFTQMAVGSYKILVAAADATNEAEIKKTCTTILESSERRAAWIEKELEGVTRTFLMAKAA
jgi:ferritin-like metal-binding protein YciE